MAYLEEKRLESKERKLRNRSAIRERKLQRMPPLERACNIHGMKVLGDLLGITRGNVNIWRERRVPDVWHKEIERVTGGKVLAEEFYFHQVVGMKETYRYCVRSRLANNKRIKWPIA